MIPKAAVRKFLNRKRDDFRPWKQHSLSRLNTIMRKLPGRPPIWKKLSKHQRVCLLLGAKYKKFAFFLDTGCGKTLLSISLIRYFKKVEKKKKFLVLVPNISNTGEWAEEIEKHSPKTKYVILEGSTEQKWDDLQESDATIYITTYLGFTHMLTVKEQTKKGVNELKISDKALRAASKIFDGLFMDESTFTGNHLSLFHRICKRLSNMLEISFPLTGTPFGKDPAPLWAQMKIVDKGYSLGETLELFRAAFYKDKINHFTGFKEYEFDREKSGAVKKLVRHRSIRYVASSADLPRMVPIEKSVRLSRDAELHYQTMQEQIQEAQNSLKGSSVALGPAKKVMENCFIHMRQISSGFIGYTDDETGEKAKLEFDDNPKLDLLMSLCEEITPAHKMVVFCEYVYSGAMIARELKKRKIGHVRIYGGTKDQNANKKKFKNDDKCKVLVLNNSCGGFGLNLQFCKYGVYFESPVSPIMRKQTRRRIHRQYSKHKRVFIYDLLVNGTYDKRTLEALAAGENLFDSIMHCDIAA